MQIDPTRVQKYLNQISTESQEIGSILAKTDAEILESPLLIRSLKYSLIVIAEAMANTLQHLLAKLFHQPISGYNEIFIKSKTRQLLSSDLILRLQPFINFRNMLVHQYWKVDDAFFLQNLRNGVSDFREFIQQIDNQLKKTD